MEETLRHRAKRETTFAALAPVPRSPHHPTTHHRQLPVRRRGPCFPGPLREQETPSDTRRSASAAAARAKLDAHPRLQRARPSRRTEPQPSDPEPGFAFPPLVQYAGSRSLPPNPEVRAYVTAVQPIATLSRLRPPQPSLLSTRPSKPSSTWVSASVHSLVSSSPGGRSRISSTSPLAAESSLEFVWN